MAFRIKHSAERTVVVDVPRGMWAFGAIFVCGGIILLGIPVRGTAWGTFSNWQRLAVLAIGLGQLAGGLFTISTNVATETLFHRATGEGRHAVRRPFRRQADVTRFDLKDVRDVEIRPARDGDGDPMYQLMLWLADSRVLPIQGQPAHNRAQAEARADMLRQVLRQ